MIKQFSAGDIITRPFKTFKNWRVQSVSSVGIDQFGRSTYIGNIGEVNRGKLLDSPFYPTGSPKYDPILEPITPNGKYERVIYSLTDSMFYRNTNNPLELFGLENIGKDSVTGHKEIRKINDKVVSVRLSENYWGEKIVPKSVTITDNSNPNLTFKIYDDGMTNLFISGSQFSTQNNLPAVNPLPPLPVWDTGSVQYYAVLNGTTQSLSFTQAKTYMDMGMNVWYEELYNGWSAGTSASRDYYQPENERFGQAVSTWFKYIAVGSPMDSDSLSDQKQGYAALFKYDENTQQHRLIKKIFSPQSQNGLVEEFGHDNNILLQLENNNFLSLENSGSFEDGFGHSVSVKENFLAVGAPTGSACVASGSNEGFVYVYDRFKGGSDNWGLINILQGASQNDRFGNAVSIDDDVLAIGAPGVSGSTGAVYIFRLKRYMDNSNPCRSIPTASFWYQINECGLPKTDATGSIIYTNVETPFFVSGNFSWEHEATLTSSVAGAGDNFGWVLQTSNNKVIVGNRKTSGNGFATLFVCNYVSASFGDCPTASWVESNTYVADEEIGDLDPNNPDYAVQATLTYDAFGWSVAMDGNALGIGSFYDKGFLPYEGAPLNLLKIMGAVYFYHQYTNDCNVIDFHQVQKTFGDVSHTFPTNFGRNIVIESARAAVSYEPEKISYFVDYSGSYILESSSYVSTNAEDGVLGRVAMYSFNSDFTWDRVGEIRRNKEAGKPFGVFGRGLALSSDFLVVGEPIYNYATGSDTGSIFDHNIQISSNLSPMYSGSVHVYDLEDYESNPYIGNVFYKNGYLVLTATGSNYANIFTGIGSAGFVMNYQGTHTIYEHEYFISIRPGEFNYSTNPSSLIDNTLLLDVNQDGVFDFSDVDLIMKYLNKKRFYEEFVFDDNGIIFEQDNRISAWWNNEILLTESGDVLMQEGDYAAYLVSSSFTSFTQAAYNYIETNLIQTGILDIDGNGVIDVNDGAILVAYFTQQLTPDALLQWIDVNSTRRYVVDIETYIGRFTGQQTFYTNPDFFNYQASSSYDPTGSYLAPYITSIGLYSEGQLVGVGKLGRPIKNLIDWPINFIVRFDT